MFSQFSKDHCAHISTFYFFRKFGESAGPVRIAHIIEHCVHNPAQISSDNIPPLTSRQSP